MPPDAPSAEPNSLSAKLPGGFVIHATGTIVAIVLVGVLLAAYVHIEGLDRKIEHQQMTDAIEVMNYINSLPQDERPRLIPPRALRRYTDEGKGRTPW